MAQQTTNMKKITLSVAALTIAMSSYSQCSLSTTDSLEMVKDNELFLAKEIIVTSEDMIEWIQYDVENGRIYKEYAELYIENLREIIARTTKLRKNN